MRDQDQRTSNSSSKRFDKQTNSTPTVAFRKNGAAQLQSLADKYVASQPIQRAINVYADERDGAVVIKADGKAKEFKDGNEAKNNGWNGVEKYKARYYVDGEGQEIGPLNNNYLVAQAGHVLAQQNGGLGSDPDNVFAQDGGINNSTYRKDFENPMRAALNDADKDDKVSFRAVLYGDNITQGSLDKESDMIDASSGEYDDTSSEEN